MFAAFIGKRRLECCGIFTPSSPGGRINRTFADPLADTSRIEIVRQWKNFQSDEPIHFWISLSPIMTLPEYFPLLLAYGAKHVVAVSSTSRFTKEDSPDIEEKELARCFVENEARLIAWAKKENLTFTILRPTLVYGLGRDKNVSTIASFIRRFSFFPVLGAARGLRQPVHAEDVALCCVAALTSKAARNKSYNVSGKDTISYREMVARIFTALHKKPRLIVFPIWLFGLAVFFLRRLSPFRYWSAAMVQRMNKDMVFDHSAAEHDLNFAPRGFHPGWEDLRRINF